MFGLTTTRRLRAAQHKTLGLQAQLGLLQGFRQGHEAPRQHAEQELADEIDAHLATIRRVLADEAEKAYNADTYAGRLESLQQQTTEGLLAGAEEALRRAFAAEADLEAERRTVASLAEQLLNATSGQSTSARRTLGLPENGPWERAVDGLNALVDAQIPFHIEPDGHISNPSGDEHIEWDRKAGRWHLVHDDETDHTTTVDEVLTAAIEAKGDGR
ncbi:hypothetical protein [Streptomyces griseus]|uniref:hypothetical protein n=1 Tax=Streptomyces griseus TaxID=1911 RepID=UPI0037FD38AD